MLSPSGGPSFGFSSGLPGVLALLRTLPLGGESHGSGRAHGRLFVSCRRSLDVDDLIERAGEAPALSVTRALMISVFGIV
jgi:hypothetical protein